LKAVIYNCLSSDSQRDESSDTKIRELEEYAKINNMEIVKIYEDHAKTGALDERPEFQQMIVDSCQGIFEAVIAHKIDCFGKDRCDSIFHKRTLKQNGIRLFSVIENLDSSPESVLLESLLEGMVEYYIQQSSKESFSDFCYPKIISLVQSIADEGVGFFDRERGTTL